MKKVEVRFNDRTIINMVEIGFSYYGVKGKLASHESHTGSRPD